MISKFFKIFSCIIVSSGLLFFSNFLYGQAQNQEFKVCDSGCPFESIQEAVDLAGNGDVIILGPGDYDQGVKVNKDLTFKPASSTTEISGSVGFSGPSLTLRQKTRVYISKVQKAHKGAYPEIRKEEVREDEAKKVSLNADDGSSLKTPLFDVSIQSKIQGKSSKEITITLIIFTVIALTILGYLVFGLIIKNRHKYRGDEDELS